MDLSRFKYLVFKAARRKGIRQFELYCSRNDSFRVGIYKGEVDTYDVSDSIGAGFRVISDGKMGYSYSEKLDETSAQSLVEEAAANAEIIDSEDREFIYDTLDTFHHIDTYSSELAKVTPQQKISLALDMEKSTFAADKEVDRVKSCRVASNEQYINISNSEGLDLEHRSNVAFAYVVPVLVRGSETQTSFAYRVGRDFDRLKQDEIAREAVEDAASYFGAGPVKSGKYPVILRNDAASDLLRTFSGIFIADNVQKGLSLLKGKIGERIASGVVKLVDAPLLKDGMCSIPFDAEGVAARNKDVITGGILKTLLYNLKTAYKDGAKSTGNASRDSYSSKVSTSPTNFYIEPGERCKDEVIREMNEGLYITELQGLHAGANVVSGDFSLAAKGFVIKNGSIDCPVEQITVAGNFYELLQNTQEAADDLRFGMPGNACFGSPALLVKELSIAGE